MSRRPLSTWSLAGALWLIASTALAQSAGEVPARDMHAWLLRIHDAASHRNFQGTIVVSGNGAISSARIAHFCEGANQFERSEALDGVARHVYRHNDVVTTMWPASKTAVVEKRDPLAQFPALLQAGDDHLADFYEVRVQGPDRIAGRDADVLVVKPRDAYRFGYRLWADRASGLLLRADVLGERSEVLESSAFSDVTIGGKARPEALLQAMTKLEGYHVVRPALNPTKLEAEGWSIRHPAPGFREVSCVKRPMAVAADATATSAGTATPPMLQTVFSDGLTYISVFIEPFDPQRHVRPLLAAAGPTQTLMQKQGNWWVTVVGDVPPATLRAFAKGLERSKK